MDRPGNQDIQLAFFYSYGSNPPLYPKWQEYFRQHQPPTLIVWGKNDVIFPAEGAHPYRRDLKRGFPICSTPGISPWRKRANDRRFYAELPREAEAVVPEARD